MVKGRTGLSTAAAFFVSLSLSSAAWAQTWSALPSMPTARASVSAAAVGDTVYVIGGFLGSCLPTSKVEAFDTATGTWSTKAPMPTPRWQAPAVAAGGKIYVLGGNEACSATHDTVEAYDPQSDSWSTVAPMPLRRRLHAAAELDGKIYVVGGVDDNFNHLTALDVYDPATDSWATKQAAPQLRHQPAAVGLDGLLYVVGGDGGVSGDPGIMVYDPATDSWSTRTANFAERRRALGAVIFNGSLYALGGNNGVLTNFAKVDEYDPAADAWISRPAMLQARADHAVAVAGGGLYAIGGFGSSSTILSSAEVFTVPVSDATAPATSAALSPMPNAAGWNNSSVTVTLTATDNEGGSGVSSITYAVAGPGGLSGATLSGATATIEITAEGTSTITYRATDNAGNVEAQKTLTVRIDKTAPGGTLTLSPSVLWPPNHRMVAITPSLSASDSGGMPVTVTGVAVSSNEPQSAGGDWTVSNGTVQLRATRDGAGSGRVYTVTYTLIDAAGNAGTVSATVTVPHDRRR
jgi:N-acetylneuraminic acid mutarotase